MRIERSLAKARYGTRRNRILRSRRYYVMLALPLAYFVIFHYLPMAGIALVFMDYNVYSGFAGSTWVGLANFRAFLWDPYFWKLLRNTFALGIYQLLFCFPMPIFFALLLNEIKNLRFKKITQTISYIPHFLSTVVVCGLIVNFTTSDGLINEILRALGLSTKQFLMLPGMFRSIYIISSIWQEMGWGSIIYLAALTGVDVSLYEAARSDGANRWQQMVHVTLPGIMPTVVIMFIFQVGAITSVAFEKILLLYNGLTYETADVIATYVYRRGLVGHDLSYATAVGLFNSLAAFCFLIVANYGSLRFTGTSLWGDIKHEKK